MTLLLKKLFVINQASQTVISDDPLLPRVTNIMMRTDS
jgi:hypothetical protein